MVLNFGLNSFYIFGGNQQTNMGKVYSMSIQDKADKITKRPTPYSAWLQETNIIVDSNFSFS